MRNSDLNSFFCFVLLWDWFWLGVGGRGKASPFAVSSDGRRRMPPSFFYCVLLCVLLGYPFFLNGYPSVPLCFLMGPIHYSIMYSFVFYRDTHPFRMGPFGSPLLSNVRHHFAIVLPFDLYWLSTGFSNVLY